MSDEPSPITVPAGIPALEAATERAPPEPAAGPDHHRHVRRRPHARGRGARGPRLVRRRQPAGADAHAPGRHADQRAGGCARAAARRRRSTSAAGSSSATSHRCSPGCASPASSTASCSSTRPTRCWCAASSRCAGRTRCRATGASSTASRRSARSSPTCASAPTRSSTPPSSTCTTSRARSGPSSPAAPRTRCAIYDRVVRVQVRHPAGRRPRGRRAVPVQPVLDHRAAAPDGPRRAGARLRARAARARSTFIDRYVDALEPVLAGYLNEEKRYVTIAVGCTGGKHRSVAVSEAIAARLRERGPASWPCRPATSARNDRAACASPPSSRSAVATACRRRCPRCA